MDFCHLGTSRQRIVRNGSQSCRQRAHTGQRSGCQNQLCPILIEYQAAAVTAVHRICFADLNHRQFLHAAEVCHVYGGQGRRQRHVSQIITRSECRAIHRRDTLRNNQFPEAYVGKGL